MKKTLLYFVFPSLMLALAGCVKKAQTVAPAIEGPEAVVRRFVDISAAVKSDEDRQRLIALCQGELRRAFERMSPEAFRLAYTASAIKIKEFSVLEKKQQTDTASVAYRVVLDNAQGSDATMETSTREVELVLVGNSWLIENIKPQGVDQIAFTRGMIF